MHAISNLQQQNLKSFSPYISITKEQIKKYAAIIAFIGWYGFALLGTFSTSGANLGMGFVLAATIPVLPAFWRDVRDKPIFWLILTLTLYILIRSIFALQTYPEIDEQINPHWTHFLRVAGLLALPMGWWLYKHPIHLHPILLTALVGFLLGIIWNTQWDLVMAGKFYFRYIWGYHPNYLGLLNAATIMALLSWLILPEKKNVLRKSWLLGLPLLLLNCFFLYTSQSRAAWLSLPVGLLVFILCVYYVWYFNKKKYLLILGSLGLVLTIMTVALFYYDQGSIFLQRISTEWSSILLILNGELEIALNKHGSISEHLQQWTIGIKAFLQKPFFGWGPGSGAIIMQKELADLQFVHFHNIYLETLVGLGVFGLVLSFIVLYCFLKAAFDAIRNKLLPTSLFTAMMATSAVTAVMLMFEIRIGQTEGRAALTFLTALYVLALLRNSDYKRK